MHGLAVASGIVTVTGLLAWAAGTSVPAPTQVVPRVVAAWMTAIGLVGLVVVAAWWAFA